MGLDLELGGPFASLSNGKTIPPTCKDEKLDSAAKEGFASYDFAGADFNKGNTWGNWPYISPEKLDLSTPSDDYYVLRIQLRAPTSNGRMASLGPVRNEALDSEEVMKANYGSITHPTCRKPPHIATEDGDSYMELYINTSLVADVQRSLFVLPTNCACTELEKYGKENPDNGVERFHRCLVDAELDTVAEIMAECFIFVFGTCWPPYSFILKLITLFVPFLNNNISISKVTPKRLTDFLPIWRDYWKHLLDNLDLPKGHLLENWGFPDPIALNHIQWSLNGGDARSMWPRTMSCQAERIERLRGPAQHLAKALHVDDNFYDANCIKGEFLRSTGLVDECTRKEKEAKGYEKEEREGGLDDLKASHLNAEPFRIAFTDKPNEHLTFSNSGTRPTVRILHLNQILKIYIAQRTGLASNAGFPSLFYELVYSHLLFFDRDQASEKFAKSQNVDVLFLKGFRVHSPVEDEFQLQDFPIYGGRLHHIRKKMNEWHPQRLRELWIRPYRDPLAFYGFWFATILGIVAVLGLMTSLAQTYAVFKTLP